jgi:hypothetical protein
MIDLGRDVIRMDSGSTSIQQSTLVHLATNSIQYYRKPQPDGTSILLQLQCDQCDMIGTVPHLTNCPSSIGIKYENDLHDSIKTLLKTNSSVTGWTQKHDDALFSTLITFSLTNGVRYTL